MDGSLVLEWESSEEEDGSLGISDDGGSLVRGVGSLVLGSPREDADGGGGLDGGKGQSSSLSSGMTCAAPAKHLKSGR